MPHKITVLGSGDMGSALVEALTKRTHHKIAVRGSHQDSISAQALVKQFNVEQATDDILWRSDIVFVVVPTKVLPDIVPLLKKATGILVSVCVSPTVGKDGAKSSAEQLAELLPQSRIVNAFTSIWADVIREPGDVEKTTAFVASDDLAAKRVILDLANEIGLEGLDNGQLDGALYAEMLGMFVVHLARHVGYGRTITFRAFKT